MNRQTNESERIRKQAIHYVVRLHSTELSEAEEKELLAWCDEHPLHQREFDSALETWDDCEVLAAKEHQPRQKGRMAMAFAFVASLCLATFLSLVPAKKLATPSADHITSERHQQTYETAVGEVSTVGLEDGTLVTLNTNTVIEVYFTDKIRHVSLLRGEVFFDVAKNKQRPFLIDTGLKTIKVVGTKFNVKKAKDVVEVAVTEGLVSVQDQQDMEPSDVERKEANALFLTAGSYASFNPSSHLVAKNRKEEVQRAQSWRSGVFRFQDERLDKVVDTFNRYRVRPIELADEQVAAFRVSGLFKLSDGDSVLKALESTLPVKVVKEKDKVVLLSK